MNQDAAQPLTGPRPATDASEAWVAAACKGDVGAFEQLYGLHLGRVYALCLRMTGNATEAEEMTQEAFVRAWQKLDSFRGNSAFSSWLHRLTVNVVLAHWRSAGRYRNRVVPFEDAGRWTEPEQRPTKGLAMDLERAISQLPRGARTVFVLHDVEGLRHREIADLTGLAVGTSKTQLHRARSLLRDALGTGANS
jgi:RNA polymerase sigma-70 factor (ECF subfamily)